MDSSWQKRKTLVLIDTDRENQIGLGIDYPFEPMNAGECIVPSRFKEYGFKLGDQLMTKLEHYGDLIRTIAENNYNPIAETKDWQVIDNRDNFDHMDFPCTIKDFSD